MSKRFFLAFALATFAVASAGCQLMQRTSTNDTTGKSEPLPKAAQYSKLQPKTYDEMTALVRELIDQANQEIEENPDGTKALLREAMEIILARPNSDNMTAQLIASPRSTLRDINAYEDVLTEIAENATLIVNDSRRKTMERASAIVILENLMTEVRPEMTSNDKIKAIFKTVAEANITVDDGIASHMRINGMMKRPASPSVIAATVLQSIQPKSRR